MKRFCTSPALAASGDAAVARITMALDVRTSLDNIEPNIAFLPGGGATGMAALRTERARPSESFEKSAFLSIA